MCRESRLAETAQLLALCVAVIEISRAQMCLIVTNGVAMKRRSYTDTALRRMGARKPESGSGAPSRSALRRNLIVRTAQRDDLEGNSGPSSQRHRS